MNIGLDCYKYILMHAGLDAKKLKAMKGAIEVLMICFRCFEPLYFRNKGSADTFINADPIRTGHIGQYPQAYNLKSGRGRLA